LIELARTLREPRQVACAIAQRFRYALAMPRELPIGNGDMLVTFDRFYQARDLYYPFVGKYNHTTGQPQRFGVWADGTFAWVDDPGWERTIAYRPDTLVGNVVLVHRGLGLRLTCSDCVDFHEPVWLRKVVVEDLGRPDDAPQADTDAGHAGEPPVRDVRLFFHIDLSIQESPVGDTANYDPQTAGLVLYKNDFYFLVNGCDSSPTSGKCGIDHWAIGSKRIGGAEGTWRDAEDGTLGMNAISQGSVDATVGFNLKLPIKGTAQATWWLICGRDYDACAKLNRSILERGGDKFIGRTDAYWRLWATKEPIDLEPVPALVRDQYRRSLLIARTQTDNRGAIMAANDSDITHFAGDTYSYCWPRDGALVAHALARAGNSELSRNFFRAAAHWITKHGYFLHKYTPDGKLASSWHPWRLGGQPVLPIQQDETALTLWALRKHYEIYRDVEFIKPLYTPLIIAPAKWMTDYRDTAGLPLQSWDLWEERRGVHTFTVAATIAALRAAAAFATDFGDMGRARWFSQGAESMLVGLRTHLYNEQQGRFARMATPAPHRAGGADEYTLDMTHDSAGFALWWLGVLDVNDPLVVADMQALEAATRVRTPIGGYARYTDDRYHAVTAPGDAEIPGNPWVICTLWQAQWRIARATSLDDLASAHDLLVWAASHAGASGVLPEQVHPRTGEPMSVSPLTWSHATFVLTTLEYLEKRRALLDPLADVAHVAGAR